MEGSSCQDVSAGNDMLIVAIIVVVITVVGLGIWFGLLVWAAREDGRDDRRARGSGRSRGRRRRR
jgi:hypothetical protein